MTAAVAAAEARWRNAHRSRRRSWSIAAVVFAAAVAASAVVGEADLGRLLRGLPMAADYIWRTIPVLRPEHLGADLDDWMWGLPGWIVLMGDTLLVAYAGSVLGAVAGLLLSFSAASTLSPPWAVAASRRVLELARTVPVLVYALVFVFAFGLGPFAGMLAIALHTMGALGKLYAEVHENAELGPLDAVRASGGSWAQGMRYGILPQSLPGVLSFGLLRFEINVREASVLGIVGAGGIGEELYLAVRQFVYPDISAILVLILLTVSCMDIGCGFLRRQVIGAPA
ncbi:phosphonate transport system permease protein [Humitalea rosea]|uniref:Phosphonate transport system permease protein n=1 Tax=Humitalea rosea TaxID=990373 RepID=A0A2W7IJ51_9PROT|nr:phosphonate ABC transporter, permease protein PhnE [Humitalea rosea]PZW38523.1 phosphonate transport system permease protein [Humitalea rosea]